MFVHASLSAISWVCGGAAVVCDALPHAVGKNGTVVMPAHNRSNSAPAKREAPPVPEAWHDTVREAMPPFDKDKAPSEGVGKIAECFRHYPETLRSGHPQTSFCMSGKDAAYITAVHALTPQFGDNSRLEKACDWMPRCCSSASDTIVSQRFIMRKRCSRKRPSK